MPFYRKLFFGFSAAGCFIKPKHDKQYKRVDTSGPNQMDVFRIKPEIATRGQYPYNRNHGLPFLLFVPERGTHEVDNRITAGAVENAANIMTKGQGELVRMKKNWKRRIFDIIQIGNVSDIPSRTFDYLLVGIILLNILVLFLETFDALAAWRPLFQWVEWGTMAFFCAEFALRIWTAEYLYPQLSRTKAMCRFLISFDGLVDLLTILPFFFLSGAVAFRMLRVVRIFHLFRINAVYDSFNVITSVLNEKKSQILFSLFIILVLMLSASLCMYSAEHEAQPDKFVNAFSGMWWSVSALLTVGYGDIYPITPVGQVLAVIISFLGVGAVAVPTGIISAGFVEQYTRLSQRNSRTAVKAPSDSAVTSCTPQEAERISKNGPLSFAGKPAEPTPSGTGSAAGGETAQEFRLRSARYLAADVLRQTVRKGDTVVDATMGNGHDTEMLCRLVGPFGHVFGFDIQAQAVEHTRLRLHSEGLLDRATLFRLGHEHLSEVVTEPVRAIVFNLGWLPGGDHQITTRTETTLSAVNQAMDLLTPGGVLVICVYPGHEEGNREKQALEEYLRTVAPQRFNILRQAFLNAGSGAPECLVVQRQ